MIAESIKSLLPSELPVVIGDLPATTQSIVGVLDYDGATSTEYFGARKETSIFNPIVKIVVRHTSYETGNQWIEQIRDTLHRYHDDFFLSILTVGSPSYLGRSAEKLHEFQIIFKTQVKE